MPTSDERVRDGALTVHNLLLVVNDKRKRIEIIEEVLNRVRLEALEWCFDHQSLDLLTAEIRRLKGGRDGDE